MSEPTKQQIDDALKQLEPAAFKSDAERHRLPVTNTQDTGAPSLRVDEVLKRSEPQHDRKATR